MIAMALMLKSTAISTSFGSVSFFMVDKDTTIRVDLDQDLLRSG